MKVLPTTSHARAADESGFRAIALLVLAGCLASVAAAHSHQTANGLHGLVSDASTGGPIRAAVVTVTGPALTHPRAVLTDDEGRFAVLNLPPGEFRVAASQAPYLAMSYGAMFPGRDGVRITLPAGGVVTGLQIRLPRGGVVAGTISDDGGVLPGATVSAIPVHLSGKPANSAAAVAQTDHAGRYRLFGLPPGQYVVAASASYRDSTGPLLLASDQIGARVAGSTEYLLLPLFYPGVASASDATVLSLATSVELQDISFAVRPVAGGTLEGRVEFPAAPRRDVSLQLCPAGPAVPLRFRTVPSLLRDDGGRFRFGGVPPGRYRLAARTGSSPTRREPTLAAAVEVTATGGDIGGMILPLQPTIVVRGTIALATTGRSSGLDLSATSVTLVEVDGPQGCLVGVAPRLVAQANREGRFAIEDVPPGRYSVLVSAPVAGWWLRSGKAGADDVLDGLLTVAEPMADLALTLTNEESGISGTLQLGSSAPAQDFRVIVFPREDALWRRHTTRVRLAYPDGSGAFSVKGIPPGNYQVAVATGVSPEDLDDPRLLALLAKGSVPAAVTGGTTRVNVKIGSEE